MLLLTFSFVSVYMFVWCAVGSHQFVFKPWAYLRQYHSFWHREQRLDAGSPQSTHFGGSVMRFSNTSKLYMSAHLQRIYWYVMSQLWRDSLNLVRIKQFKWKFGSVKQMFACVCMALLNMHAHAHVCSLYTKYTHQQNNNTVIDLLLCLSSQIFFWWIKILYTLFFGNFSPSSFIMRQ